MMAHEYYAHTKVFRAITVYTELGKSQILERIMSEQLYRLAYYRTSEWYLEFSKKSLYQTSALTSEW